MYFELILFIYSSNVLKVSNNIRIIIRFLRIYDFRIKS